MKAKYLIRLDDACTTFTLAKWEKFFHLFEQFGIKPIIAVIPNNEDESLKKEKRDEADFWRLVQEWHNRGYCIAMHGYNHLYTNRNSGILKITKHSEYAGIPIEEQKRKLKLSQSVFEKYGIKPDVFVAPSHSFDKNTVMALQEVTTINVISDGLSIKPYKKWGLQWLPCQLWWPQKKKYGVWTLCVHPETITNDSFDAISSFIEQYHSDFIAVDEVLYGILSFKDHLYKYLFYFKRSPISIFILKEISKVFKHLK